MHNDADSWLEVTKFMEQNCPGILWVFVAKTDNEFDLGLEGLLEKAIIHLEKNANHLFNLGEEAISAFLVAYICMPGLRAVQEVHSKGHVDITIEAEHSPPVRRRLGEAKIYKDHPYHVKGLEQLFLRYATGREGTGILIEYVKKPKIKDLVEKIKIHMDTEKPCAQDGDSEYHRIKWAFTTNHKHRSGELLRVLHLSCNLHISGKM